MTVVETLTFSWWVLTLYWQPLSVSSTCPEDGVAYVGVAGALQQHNKDRIYTFPVEFLVVVCDNSCGNEADLVYLSCRDICCICVSWGQWVV